MSMRGTTGEAPRRADAVRNRQRALTAARDLLVELGPRVTVDEIARRAGMGSGTVVRAFGSKEALLDAAAASLLDPVLQRTRDALADEDVEPALRALLTELIAFVVEGRAVGVQLEGTATPLTDTKLAELHQAIATLVIRAQHDGAVRADLDATVITELVSHVAHAAARPTVSDRLSAEQAVSFVMHGLTPDT